MEGLYRDRILAHARDSANQQRLSCPDCAATVDNPLCGDRMALELRLEGERVAEVGLAVRACVLTSASASMLRAYLTQRPLAEVRAFLPGLHGVLVESEAVGTHWPDSLLPLLELRHQRARLRCLELPWLALAQCLEQLGESARG